MNWEKRDIPPELVKDLAAKYGCDQLTASILARRDIIQGDELRYFLEEDLRYLRNAFELPGMEDAVDRIIAAKEEGEKVLVFGDRDVDGITSTTLLWSFLSRLGMDVSWCLPQGDEPYGLSIKAVEEFAAAYGTLIITVDCGVSNAAEVARARELGVDVVITDHHNLRDELPDALAIVNPKLAVSPPYPFRDLAGCGVAYKLVWALRFALKSQTYGQSICLLNIRPSNDAYVIEIAKLRNLVVIDRLLETVVPGMVGITDTRLPRFLEGQQILAWDAPLQQKTLLKIFGSGVEIHMLEIAAEIGKEIPQTVGKSLLRLKELSRIARYSDKVQGELDIFINLFTSFIQKRENLFTDEDEADLQLASLGTVADIMPLRDENRIIVRQGIEALKKAPRPALQALLLKMGLAGRRISAGDLSWKLCPVINAAGRMGDPGKAVNLLLREDAGERDRLADELIALNEDRKTLGNDIWTKVEPLAEESLKDFGGTLVIAAGENIPRGVTGIMATRLVSRFKAPAVVVSLGEETAAGSCRSVKGYDLRSLLEQCADLFIDWGGHDYAAGFSIEKSNWEPLRERLKIVARTIELGEKDNEETITIDAELPHSYLAPDILIPLIDRFEPYGEGNRPLIFLARGLKISDMLLMGKPEIKHVKLTLDAGKYKWPGVYWQAADKVKKEFDTGDQVDLVFEITRNWFNHTETPQLVITDLKRSVESGRVAT
ncbi:MAG: single-stranded-DNA-specific exonuclease RecJ [Spirochaetaceae bacterium]|jgi:single-stranded-DNA-specific exonuclease|nr:single-stranded-DNA-specific exonuclease RecJ [Spirochaetaceae bacterium]